MKNTKTKNDMKKTDTVAEHHEESWNRAAARGALLWGTVYSTATSGVACLLAPMVGNGVPAFGDVFVDSLIIFPSAGAVRGVMMWRVRKRGRELDNANTRFLSSGHREHRHPWRVHASKAA